MRVAKETYGDRLRGFHLDGNQLARAMCIILALELRLAALNQLLDVNLAVRQQREVQLRFLRRLTGRRIASIDSGLSTRVVPRLRHIDTIALQPAHASVDCLRGDTKLASRLGANTVACSQRSNDFLITYF